MVTAGSNKRGPEVPRLRCPGEPLGVHAGSGQSAGVRRCPLCSRPSGSRAMEPGAAELYDQALLGILQHVGNVQDFLRVLFGFLYRKTDFYRLLRHPSDRMGFPPGAAQALVLQVRWGAAASRWDPSGPYPSSTSRHQRCPRLASYVREQRHSSSHPSGFLFSLGCQR